MQSITWDQGTEMARHLVTAHKLGAPIYFTVLLRNGRNELPGASQASCVGMVIMSGCRRTPLTRRAWSTGIEHREMRSRGER